MQNNKLPLRSKEQLELQVSQVDLLMGMYPSEDELVVDPSTTEWLDVLRNWTSSEQDITVIEKIPATLSLELIVEVNVDDHESQLTTPVEGQRKLHLTIDIPVRTTNESGRLSTNHDSLQPTLKVRARQPPWLTRSQTTLLNTSIPLDLQPDIFAAIDHIRTEAAQHVATSTTHPSTLTTTTPISTPTNVLSRSHPQPLVRVWFYFPSLSTRTKRADLVTHAPQYSLTGFVLAGKPGILCLEGTSRDIDEYMRFIKTESWGDIPSHQKKVSERLREELGGADDGGVGRVFEGMREITDCEFMGERRGERGNRGDLRALEGWLGGYGLEGVLQRVLM